MYRIYKSDACSPFAQYLVFLFLLFGLFFTGFGITAAESAFTQLEARLKAAPQNEKVEILLNLSQMCLYRREIHQKMISYASQALKLSQVQGHKQDSAYAMAYLGIAYVYAGDHVKSQDFSYRAFQLAREIGDSNTMGSALVNIGASYCHLLDYKTALGSLRRALKIYETSGRGRGYTEALMMMGTTLEGLGELEEALAHYRKAAAIFTSSKKYYELMITYSNIAVIYKSRKQYKKALEFRNRVMAIAIKQRNKKMMAFSYSGIGTIYAAQGELEKALQSYLKCMKINEEDGDRYELGRTLNNISRIYFYLNRLDKALEYNTRSIEEKTASGNHVEIPSTMMNTGFTYARMKQFSQAYQILSQAMQKARDIGNEAAEGNILKAYSDVYLDEGKFKESLKYHIRYHEFEKNRLDQNLKKQIDDLHTIYETGQKQNRLLKMKRDKELEELQLSHTRMTRNLWIGGILSVGLFLGLLLRKYIHLVAFWKKERMIGQFRLMEELGSGGMGTVYKAINAVDKKETTALKVLNEDLFSDETSRKRFQREGDIIAQMAHPHIVDIFCVARYRQTFYIVMEYLEGLTLENKINRAQTDAGLDIRESLHILRQIADALAFVHRKNVIHRDIKPANIMLVQNYGDPNYVKLLDFGVARIEFQTHLTQTGAFLGTLEYMAPEQVMDAETSKAIDIFSLGVTAYRMLTGRKPFHGTTVIEIMRNIVTRHPDPPINLRPDIPEDLDKTVMAMLTKHPSSRPSAEDIHLAFEHLCFNC